MEFIQDGALQGRREDLVGGSLQRSRKIQFEQRDEMELYDDRVLGSGDCIERLRRNEALQEKMMSGMALPELAARVEEYFGIEKRSIGRRSMNRQVLAARVVYCFLAVRLLRYSGTHVGEILNIGRSAAVHAVRRGERIIERNDDLIGRVISSSAFNN